MTDDERRAWIRTLAFLVVVAAARWGWAHRPGGPTAPGIERDVAAAVDTVRALQTEEARRSRPLAPGETLDPNRADAVDLDRLPGVGPATADAIMEARRVSPFLAVDDLLAVRGIGPATLARIAPHLRIPPGAPRPSGTGRRPAAPHVNVNRADLAELQRLPGIGPALADRVIRDRIEHGPFASADDLARVRGIGPATVERIRSLVRVR